MIWARNGHPDKDVYVVMVFMQMVRTFDSHAVPTFYDARNAL